MDVMRFKMVNTICIIILLFGCENTIKNQVEYLLPSINNLVLISENEIGITEYKVYKVEGDLDNENISQYPLNQFSNKLLVKWHKPTKNELQDIRLFFEKEQTNNQIAIGLLNQLSNQECLVAVIYDKDESPIGLDRYSIYNWIELYFLNTSEKKLTHISYGR